MKAFLLGAALLAATTAGVSAQDVVITPERETVIREYVKTKPVASISVPGVELNVGTTLPETVEVHPMDIPDAKYEYVVIDNRTVIVEPGTRKIIKVYD